MQGRDATAEKYALMLDRFEALWAVSRGLDRAGRYENADAVDAFARRVALNFDDKIDKGGAAWVTDPLPPGLSVPGLQFAGSKGMYWTKDRATVERLRAVPASQLSGGAGQPQAAQPARPPAVPQAAQPARAQGAPSVERAKTENEYYWVTGIPEAVGRALGMAFSERKGGRWGTADAALAAELGGTPPGPAMDALVARVKEGRSRERAERRSAGLSLEPAGRADEQGRPLWRVKGNAYKYRQVLRMSGAFSFDKESKEWLTADPSAIDDVNEAAEDPKHPLWQAGTESDSYSDEGYSEEAHRRSYSGEPRGDVQIPVPAGLKLEPYQVAAAEMILSQEGSLLFDEPGVGKSAPAAVVINADPSIRSVLIICPAALKEGWRRQLVGQGEPVEGKPETIGWLTRRDLSVGVAEGSVFPSTDIVIINYEIVPRHKAVLQSKVWDYVIKDEGHRSKESDVTWTEAIIGKHNRYEKLTEGIRKKRAVDATGTPAPSAVEELFTQLHFVRPDLFPNRKKFEDTFCEIENVRREVLKTDEEGKKELVTVWVPTIVGVKNVEMLNRILFGGGSTKDGAKFGGLAMRRLMSDLGEEFQLPEKRRDVYGVDNPHDLEDLVRQTQLAKELASEGDELDADQVDASGLSAGQGRQMESLRSQVEKLVSGIDAKMSQAKSMDDLVNIEKEYLEAVNADFGEIAQYRRLTGLAKVDSAVKQAVRYLQEPPQAGADGVARPNKVVVFAVHNEVVERIAARLQAHFASAGQPWKVAVVYGPTAPGERVKAFDGVQGDPGTRVIVISTAAKEGVTLTGANRMVVAEFSWTPGDMSQIEARIHRKSQDRPVSIAWLVLNDSLDGLMLKKISEKTKLHQALLDYRLPAPQRAAA